MRSWTTHSSENLTGLISHPSKKTVGEQSLLILLHGVGANEKSLCTVGEQLAPDEIIVSLRAPLILGESSFGWFHVQFTPEGPRHNWAEAEASFKILEQEIKKLSQTYNAPLKRIAIMGFSQGSIMTMGLALKSSLTVGHYLCFSGRTLPEFSDYARKHPETVKGRRIFLTHGSLDDKLPVGMAHKSRELLEELKANYHYLEFPGGHGIQENVLKEARTWMSF